MSSPTARTLTPPSDGKTVPKAADAAAKEPEQSRRQITLPIDRVAQQAAIRDVFVNAVGANVLSKQMRGFVSDGEGKTNPSIAQLFFESIRESVQPRDALEEMLLVQMAWTHARLARLSAIATDQEQRANVQIVHDACDRAANTFRRQMLTLAEYRRPPQPGNFVAIKQANLANQQVVQNVESQNAIASNEQGSAPALPPVKQGFDFPSDNGGTKQALAAEHRPDNRGRQGPIQAERHQTRGAKRPKPGGVAGVERGVTSGQPG